MAREQPERDLPVQRPQVAGVDLGSREHWACGPPRADGRPNVRTFGTTTAQLDALADWPGGRRRGIGGAGEHVCVLDPIARVAGGARFPRCCWSMRGS